MGASARSGLAVLVSGAGTNLRAVLDAASAPDYPAQVVAVASNRPGCPALEMARQAAVPARAFPVRAGTASTEDRDREMAGWLLQQGTTLVALAGYDRILRSPMLEAFPGRILNLHNSLLPAFSGTMDAVAQALEHGVKVTGCTVHLVDERFVDGGPIVLQAAVPVLAGDTQATLLERIHREEWRLLPEAIALLAAGRLRIQGRQVLVSEPCR
ncbi:MAG: phosphoribosylglycinamide formyltransferase [Candidatus Dormibacteria bacterium]